MQTVGERDMAFAVNEGVRIHYEVEGQGSPLVVQHGYSDSLETWYELGYVSALKQTHLVILVDARGHGASDKPHVTSAYAQERQAADVIAVLDELRVQRTDYWGYSMGGRIGFALARHAPERFRCFVLGGAGGDGRSRIGDGFRKALKEGGAAAIPGLWGAELPEALRARLLANDVEALDACRVDSLGFADVLPTMIMPCLLYAGSADPVHRVAEETVAEMPDAEFFTLPDLGHAEGLFRSELVLPRVTDFLHRVAGRQ
jgi:pimeloyl-ACP methyl ester carboxylesterase